MPADLRSIVSSSITIQGGHAPTFGSLFSDTTHGQVAIDFTWRLRCSSGVTRKLSCLSKTIHGPICFVSGSCQVRHLELVWKQCMPWQPCNFHSNHAAAWLSLPQAEYALQAEECVQA